MPKKQVENTELFAFGRDVSGNRKLTPWQVSRILMAYGISGMAVLTTSKKKQEKYFERASSQLSEGLFCVD